MTEPTAADFLDFAKTWAWDSFASYIMGRLANKSTELEKPEELQQHAQQLVRSLVKYIWSRTAKPLVEQKVEQRRKLLQTTDTALE